MSVHRYSHGERFYWGGELFEVDHPLPDDFVEFHSLAQDWQRVEPRRTLDAEWLSGNLVFVPRSLPSSVNQKIEPSYAGQSLDDFDPELVAVARWRLESIAPLVKKRRLTTADVEARVAEVRLNLTEAQQASAWYRISPSTAYEWMKTYRESGHDIRSLIPDAKNRGGRGQSRLDPLVNQILEAAINDLVFGTELGASIDEVSDEVKLRIQEVNTQGGQYQQPLLSPPDRSTVGRRIAGLKLKDKLKHLEEPGRKSHRGRVPRRSRQLMPLDEIEIDTTTADIMAVDDQRHFVLGRMTFVSAMDVATSYPLGYYMGFEPESHYTSMECLFHAILPKVGIVEKYGIEAEWLAQGIPKLVRFDRGKGYNNQHVKDASELLEFELDKLEPRTPFLKPFIERTFRTTNDGVFHYLDGTTFSNYVKRGDYDSLAAATLTCYEIERQLLLFLLKIYAERPHRGLGSVSPVMRWRELTQAPFGFRLPGSARDLIIALGWVDERAVEPYGIEMDYIRYQDDAKKLAKLREIWGKSKAKIKYHPGDLSRIYVWNPEARADEERYVEIPARDQEYTKNLSSWQHRIILNYQREVMGEIDRARFAEARREMRKSLEQARQETRTLRAQRRAERMISIPPSQQRLDWEGDNDQGSAPQAPASGPAVQISEADLVLDPSEERKWRIVRANSAERIDLDVED